MASTNPYLQTAHKAPSPTSRIDDYPLYHHDTPGYPQGTNPMPTHPAFDNWKPSAPPPRELPTIDDKSELDDYVTDLVRCDDEYCPDFPQLLSESIFEISRLQHPQLYTEMVRCNDELLSKLKLDSNSDYGDVCKEMVVKATQTALPTLDSLCDAKRFSSSPDPLYGYHGMDFPDPFWFEGAGEVWRRTSSGSVKITIDDCKKVRRVAEQCLLDETKPNDYCFHLYQHAIMCEPGTNCPYLRLPMVRCTYLHNQVDYKSLKDCIDLLPNVEKCRQGWVPVDPDDPNPMQFIPASRVRALNEMSH
jgi:hypothetical protein